MTRFWLCLALLCFAPCAVGAAPSLKGVKAWLGKRTATPVCAADTKVIDAYKALAPNEEAKKDTKNPAPPPPRERTVQLGDTLAVELDKPAALTSQACGNKAVVLLLNGLPLEGLSAQPPTVPESKIWKFPLQITDDSRETWSELLGRPDFGTRKMTVNLGVEDEGPLASDNTPMIEMKILPTFWLAVWGGIFLLMLAVFICSALNTNILRGGASDGDAPAGAQPAYSLSKTQAAWWFFIILACYLLIGTVTGDFSNSLNATALTLLGIGAGTALGSAVISNSKATPQQQEAKKEAAEQAKQTYEQLTAAIEQTRTAQAVPARAAQIPKSIATLPAQRDAAAAAKEKWSKLSGQSTHFLTDILSDANGVSFHRFQMAVWTLVLSIIFIKDVYLTLAMPTFNATLLGLLGLSAGTYLGLKIPEPSK